MGYLVRRAAAAIACAFVLASLPASAKNADSAKPTAAASKLQFQKIVYLRKLAEYRKARAAYEKRAAPYWKSISEKRSLRRSLQGRGQQPAASHYVLQQPPLYAGPPEPKNPEKSPAPGGQYVPVVADFLREAQQQFGFEPELPANDGEYRRAYAKAALAAGLTAGQCVKIYGFESGGDGNYAVQAGLEYGRPGERAITTALGYNQLLATNSIEMLAEAGGEFLAVLNEKAARASGARRDELAGKISVLKKMIAFSRTVPDQWAAHGRLAGTAKGLGIHALNLDVDIGPLLQVRKLLTSVEFAQKLGYTAPLTAAELEMMNLTGDGNGFDMVVMPRALREKVPTANFFQPGGYERNPVAIRNDTVAKLIAATDEKMEAEAKLPGARELARAFRDVR